MRGWREDMFTLIETRLTTQRSGQMSLRFTARRARRRAITLVELLIALTIASLVGLATVGMLTAAAYGSTSQLGMRKLMVVTRTVSMRVNHAISTCLDFGVQPAGNNMIIWVEDTNDDDVWQYGEILLLEYDSTNKELLMYRDTSDTTDFTTYAAFRLNALANYTSACWASGVTDVDFEKSGLVGSEPNIVSYRITIERDGLSDTVIGAAAVRNTIPTP